MANQYTIMGRKVSVTQWSKLLTRWTGLSPTGEVRLICAVLADGVANSGRPSSFFPDGFSAYCRLVGLNPEFVMEQVERARKYGTASLERVPFTGTPPPFS